MRFVDEAGIWEVPGRTSYCAHCGARAHLTYVTELREAKKGPGPRAYCNVYHWAKHAESYLVVKERSSEPRKVTRIRGWAEASSGYPPDGDQGITVTSVPFQDTLTYRLADGKLVGILQHFPRGRHRAPGLLEVYVDPDHRGQRIGTKLVREATRRWGVDLSLQRSTDEGYGMERHALLPSPAGPRV